VKLTSDSSEDVWVTVSILPAGSREFEFPTKNIEVKNKPKDLQVTFETAQIEVRIKSDNKDLDDLNNDKDIKAYIDLDGKKEGSYEVPVEIVLIAQNPRRSQMKTCGIFNCHFFTYIESYYDNGNCQ